MYPHLFDEKLGVNNFTLMIVLGVLIALSVFFWLCKKQNVPQKTVDRLCFLIGIVFLGGFGGAMLFDKIAHWGETPWWKPAGIAFSGGLIGGAIVFCIFYFIIVAKDERDFFKHIDIFAPCLVIAHSFGRVGCFLGGCCYGKETDSIFGVVFPEGSPAHDHYGYAAKVLPTQLFEALFLLVLFVVLITLVRRYRVCVYLIAYGVFRFVNEFMRGDNRGSLSDVFSPSQLLSFVIVTAGVTLIYFYRKYSPTNNKPPAKNE